MRPDSVTWSGDWMIWEKIYPSCGSDTAPIFPLSTPFTQVSSAQASGSIE